MRSRGHEIPDDHSNCGPSPCIQCVAEDHLLPEDWEIIEFYQLVYDQVTCLTPSGGQNGQYEYAPRLEAWVLGLRMLGISRDWWMHLISQARMLMRLSGQFRGVSHLFSVAPDEYLDQFGIEPDEDEVS